MGVFFMELKNQNLLQIKEKIHEFSQITFDEDYIIRDNKPDVAKLVAVNKVPVLEEVKSLKDGLWVDGKVNFEALYRSDSRNLEPESFKGEIGFQEKIYVDGLSETDNVKVYCEIEDLSFNVVNSRKLSIRGIINLEIISQEQENVQVNYKAVPEEELQQQREKTNLLKLQGVIKDIIRIKNELTIQKSKPNIQKIIYTFMDIRNQECDFQGNEFVVKGEAHLSILYLSEDGMSEWHEEMMPISGKIHCDKVYNPDVFSSRVCLIQENIEAQSDYDKEMRKIGIELVFDVEAKAWKEEEIEILKDMYSTTQRIEPVYKELIADHLRMKNVTKNRVSQEFSLEQNEEKILQICGSRGKVEIESVQINEAGIWVEGFLEVEILYITGNDGFPIAHLNKVVPFEQQVEITGILPEDHYEINKGIDILQVSLLDSSEYEVKATISLEVLVISRTQISVIDSVNILENKETEDQSGIVGYVVKSEETLWDIAKQYRIKIEDIKSINNLTQEKVEKGDKLLIVKNIS